MMTGEQKLDFIRDQISEIRAGVRSFVLCPYCGTENTPVDKNLCCPLFAAASAAVLDRMEKQAAIDFLNSVNEKVH
jgi:hypothetical protein